MDFDLLKLEARGGRVSCDPIIHLHFRACKRKKKEEEMI